MLRSAFNVAVILSLVLLCAAIGLWCRGQFVTDRLSHQGGNADVHITFGTDVIRFSYMTPPWVADGPKDPYHNGLAWNTEEPQSVRMHRKGGWVNPDWEFLGLQKGRTGFSYQASSGAYVTNSLIVYVSSYWLFMVVTMILPAIALILHFRLRRRARRLRSNHCLVCGYDLRATPDSCPECGWKRATTQPAG